MTNRTGRVALAAIAAALAFAGFSAASASSCRDPDIVRIEFAKGAYCWVYEGNATHFRGVFRKGQTVRVEMWGLAYFASPTGSDRPEDLAVEWNPRSVDATGPRDAFLQGGDEDGALDAVLPYSGTYEFGFGPCFMWHNFGRVVICAR
jgi:hypothetical protein